MVERAAVAAAASGKAGGFLAGGWGSGPTVRMHEVGFAMHEELADTLEVTSYRKIPTLQVGPCSHRRCRCCEGRRHRLRRRRCCCTGAPHASAGTKTDAETHTLH